MLSFAEQGRHPACIRCRPPEESRCRYLLMESNKRQQDVEGSTFGELALDFNLSAMFLNDAMHNGKPETGAIIFCGEERIKHMRDIFTTNSLAAVANGDAQHLAHIAVCAWNRPLLGGTNLRGHS